VPVLRCVLILRRLLIEIERFYLYEPKFEANYEDLYYLCVQIHDHFLFEYENPIIHAFIERINQDIEKIRHHFSDDSSNQWERYQLFSEAMNYIKDVTWRMLLREPENNEYLDFIYDISKDPKINTINIYTLNHDTLIEGYLIAKGLNYADGFGKPANNIRYWENGLLKNTKEKINIFKLHGSINWFQFPPNDISPYPEAVGIPLGNDIWHQTSPSGNPQHAYGGRPIILAGIFNKMLDYTVSIFADLHCLFRESLRGLDRLIISGYGFRDKGINSQIVEWMHQKDNNSIILIHPNPNRCKMDSRGVIIKHWDYWKQNNRLKIISCGIEDINWPDIKKLL
jgi:hypothetical protein